MNAMHWILLIMSGLLASCAAPHEDKVMAAARAVPNPCQILVQLDENGEIVVDHEPVRTKRCGTNLLGKKVAFWRIDASTVQGYKFSTNGIEFEKTKNAYPDPDFPTGCVRIDGGNRFSCEFGAKATGRKWSYTINLEKAQHNPKSADPTVVND